MSNGVELQPKNLTQGVTQNPEPAVEPNVQPTAYLIQASGDENGAIFFALDWNNRQAEILRETLIAIFGKTAAEKNPKGNPTSATWSDFVNLAKEHKDFAEFRRHSENFWKQVSQMSETKIFKDAGGSETQIRSRFDKLLTDMQEKKMSLREFAQTLPPNEKNVFKACYQLSQTFGANIFNADGAAPNQSAQPRFGEVPIGNNHPADLREGKFVLSAPAVTHGAETLFGAKSATLLGASVFAAPNIVSQTALGITVGASSILSEGFASRGLTNAAPENTGAIARRDGGTVIGGALINGAFAAIDNHKNSERDKIGDSQAGKNIFGENGNGFAAGATGAMFGATIGKVIPDAGTIVSGVLGFVSSVVVGVDADQGLRWLGASEMNFSAIADGGANANNQTQLTTGNSLLSDTNLQPALA